MYSANTSQIHPAVVSYIKPICPTAARHRNQSFDSEPLGIILQLFKKLRKLPRFFLQIIVQSPGHAGTLHQHRLIDLV